MDAVQLFQCQVCSQLLFFENTRCESCGSSLGYDAATSHLEVVVQDGDIWRPSSGGDTQYRFCDNAQYGACNWLVAADSPETYCAACRHNRTIPALSEGANLQRWQKLEAAKHRLFYQLIKLNLPLPTLAEDPAHGLAFDFLADPPAAGGPRVLTGHDDGLITLNLAEADDAAREALRTQMGEPYRTLLGHFRHEIGHFYWDLLVRDGHRLEQCRAVFGDDQEDYGQALQRHYQEGPPPGWQNDFISHYATTHAWEDFAETWAHYLHILDTLETAKAFGIAIHPMKAKASDLHADITLNPYGEGPVEGLIDDWLPLTFAVNSLNRSMGISDLYPFILSTAVIQKMDFIHRLVQGRLPADQPAVASMN
jgi:hypothetical protein